VTPLIEMTGLDIIKTMANKRQKLTSKELAAQKSFFTKLNVHERKTKKPIIVAMIGLVGSGKSSVAQELAKHIGATVIEGDDIRVELRKQNEQYKHARIIAENITLEVINKGGNFILDSDFIDPEKRATLREKAQKAGIHLLFVCTYAEIDVMVGRIITANYHDKIDDFFGGASSQWEGSEQSKGAVIKFREMLRRLPHHYRWEDKGGGQWVIKKPPCKVIADIDTTDPKKWKLEVEKCAKQIKSL
jgi:predicted kinase